MNKDSIDRKVDFPNLGDYEVLDKLKGLRKVFKVHNRILNKTGESYPYYSDELEEFIIEFNTFELWKECEYSFIEEIYVQAWIKYFENVFDEYVYFTVEEFIDGTAEIVLKK